MLAEPEATGTEASASSHAQAVNDWIDICAVADITPGTGVAALVDGDQVALIRPAADDRVYALSNFDPFSKAFVIARGIVGDRGGKLKVASPIYKQNFDLAKGQCMDDPDVVLPVYQVRVVGGRVHVHRHPKPGST
jgi:nitrite reductase (NADH) small subunit